MRRLAAFAILVAACALHGCGPSSDPASGPQIIGPQPIPDAALDIYIDAKDLRATASGGQLTITGIGTSSGGAKAALLATNLTRGGSPVPFRAGGGTSSTFSLTVPGALGDALRFDGDGATYALQFVLNADGSARPPASCILVESGVATIELPEIDIGVSYVAQLSLANACEAPVVIGRASVLGDTGLVATRASGVRFAAHEQKPLPFDLRSQAAGAHSALVVFDVGSGDLASVRIDYRAR